MGSRKSQIGNGKKEMGKPAIHYFCCKVSISTHNHDREISLRDKEE